MAAQLVACSGGGDESRNLLAAIGVEGSNGFLVWEGNDNGEFVVDVNGDAVRFANQTRALVYGTTIYPETFVDVDGTLVSHGNLIGGLWYVQTAAGGRVVGLIGTNENWLDIFGPESTLAWQQTALPPVINLLPLRIAPTSPQPLLDESALARGDVGTMPPEEGLGFVTLEDGGPGIGVLFLRDQRAPTAQ